MQIFGCVYCPSMRSLTATEGTSIFASTVRQLGRRTFELRHYKFVDKISHPTTSPERSAEFAALATNAMHLGAGEKGGKNGNCKLLAVLMCSTGTKYVSAAFPYPGCDAFLGKRGKRRITHAGNASTAQPRRGCMTSIPPS